MERKTEVRGKQEDGGVGGPAHWFPLATGGCAGFGPLRSVACRNVGSKGESLSITFNKLPLIGVAATDGSLQPPPPPLIQPLKAHFYFYTYLDFSLLDNEKSPQSV